MVSLDAIEQILEEGDDQQNLEPIRISGIYSRADLEASAEVVPFGEEHLLELIIAETAKLGNYRQIVHNRMQLASIAAVAGNARMIVKNPSHLDAQITNDWIERANQLEAKIKDLQAKLDSIRRPC